MAQYIGLYFASDDTKVSQSGDFSNPVEFDLNAEKNETGEVRLYVLADSGYYVENTSIQPTGDTSNRWYLAPDNSGSPGTYNAAGESLSLGTVDDTSKVYFWVKAEALSTEDPQVDESVTVDATGDAYPA